jgi:hypothetical protein
MVNLETIEPEPATMSGWGDKVKKWTGLNRSIPPGDDDEESQREWSKDASIVSLPISSKLY